MPELHRYRRQMKQLCGGYHHEQHLYNQIDADTSSRNNYFTKSVYKPSKLKCMCSEHLKRKKK